MLRKLLKRLLALAITTLFSLGAFAVTQVPPAVAQCITASTMQSTATAAGKFAFPTAQGFGRNAKGGRGV